jgi:hypothetical protein
MPLIFSSLFAKGVAPSPPPSQDVEAGFVWTQNLLYHFRSTSGVFSDAAGAAIAQPGDPVARWANQGLREDALQSSPARRPILRSGGLGGLPYLACAQDQQQFFEDLAFTQPSGLSSIDPFTVFAVTDAIDPAWFPAILGSSASNGGKVGFYFRPPAGEQIHFVKSQIRVGNVADPQIVMAAIGRNAAGVTSTPAVRLWLRQNGINVWDADFQSSNLVSTAIAATQFLRNTSLTPDGFFHGRLYEFLLYGGTLDNQTTFAVEDFLADKYGIQPA